METENLSNWGWLSRMGTNNIVWFDMTGEFHTRVVHVIRHYTGTVNVKDVLMRLDLLTNN